MNKSSIFYFKTAFILIGFTLLSLGFFTEFQSTCRYVDDFEDIVPISIPGSKSTLWYFFSLGSVAIFLIGFFFGNLANKILVYCVTGILSPFIGFMTLISQAGWGNPCGYYPEHGYYLTLLGSLLVLVATIISMHRKKKIVATPTNELLDQE
ncbi:hypothetical protein [Fluviicola taffensis]|uniref:Uncharacterized protein n=1 Tax=Fluviicola taffensis (strain DSM 16823 / NCIMB 13979 / RW262) TaxID=755732 RepID=F2IG21_FLUTR|nr:hypothetical protein [Fluviicola taffensis]AEA44656.1 hypothetical protein Fluta_2675 [Fluviicola taffensis DSM 16823]